MACNGRPVRSWRRWPVVFNAILISACATQPNRNPASTERLLSNFERVVFHDEYDDAREIGRIRKWTDPVRIAVFGDHSLRYQPVVAGYVNRLEPLTGLDLSDAHEQVGDHGSNFQIHPLPWDEMEAAIRPHVRNPEWLSAIIDESSCLFVFESDEHSHIQRAMIFISTDESFEENASCLLEEMVQALGLPNDSELIRPSVFNQWDDLRHLPVNDQILVRTLYDESIPPGMPRAAALRQARVLIERLSGQVKARGEGVLAQ